MNQNWTINELSGFLADAVKLQWQPRITLFVDALDEGDLTDVRQMVSVLEGLTRHTYQCHGSMFRVFLSSRHYPHISAKRGLSLLLENQSEHTTDIQAYINLKLIVEDDATAKMLHAKLQKRSGNIFWWVVLVIPMLNKMHDRGCSVAMLLEPLHALPHELHGLFRNVTLRDKTNIASTVRLFQWLLFALQPLTPTELYAAVRFSSSEPVREEDVSESGVAKRYPPNCSRGLAELVELEKIPMVQLIHEPVRDFLLGKQALTTLEPNLSSNIEAISQVYLAHSCQQQVRAIALPTIQSDRSSPMRSELQQ